MEEAEIRRAIEAILFAAGDPVGIERMALAIGAGTDQIEAALKELMDAYSFERRGMRIIRLEDAYQMVSAQELSDVITRALETRKPPKLSASALETLTVIAYYQPTTKAFVEQIRGVDSSYTISALLNKKRRFSTPPRMTAAPVLSPSRSRTPMVNRCSVLHFCWSIRTAMHGSRFITATALPKAAPQQT